ncbi:hypothetical protein D3C77_512300 [compost metagenome]
MLAQQYFNFLASFYDLSPQRHSQVLSEGVGNTHGRALAIGVGAGHDLEQLPRLTDQRTLGIDQLKRSILMNKSERLRAYRGLQQFRASDIAFDQTPAHASGYAL